MFDAVLSPPNLLAKDIASFVDALRLRECMAKIRGLLPSSVFHYGFALCAKSAKSSSCDWSWVPARSQLRVYICRTTSTTQGGDNMRTIAIERAIQIWIARIDLAITNYILPSLFFCAGILLIVLTGWGICRWRKRRASFRQS